MSISCFVLDNIDHYTILTHTLLLGEPVFPLFGFFRVGHVRRTSEIAFEIQLLNLGLRGNLRR